MGSRSDILSKIEAERERQFNLPGSEQDVQKTPNDFIAIAGHYLFENVRRGSNAPIREQFEDSLIKSAAVILAALESVSAMESLGHFEGGNSNGFAETLKKISQCPQCHKDDCDSCD